MALYKVTIREVFTREVEIQAEDQQHARVLVNAGKGKRLGESKFLVQMTPEHWDVEEAAEEALGGP